jgi:hypothetical protein
LFFGSDRGGKTAAILLSLVSSCQRHGLDPFSYLEDVLYRLSGLPKHQLAQLLPDRWQNPMLARSQSIAGELHAYHEPTASVTTGAKSARLESAGRALNRRQRTGTAGRLPTVQQLE